VLHFSLFTCLQVMPVHAARMLPGSDQIATNMPQLMAAFDPAKPLTFQVSCLLTEDKQLAAAAAVAAQDEH
jgi:hypothetical protein